MGKRSYKRLNITLVNQLRKKINELKESEEKFRNVFNAVANAIFIADPKTGKLIDANKAAEKLVGRTRKEIIGMHQTKLHPPEKVKGYAKKFKEFAKLDLNAEFEAEAIRKDGRIVSVFLASSLIRFGGKPAIIGSFSNISKLKKTEEKLNSRIKQLEKSNKLLKQKIKKLKKK